MKIIFRDLRKHDKKQKQNLKIAVILVFL